MTIDTPDPTPEPAPQAPAIQAILDMLQAEGTDTPPEADPGTVPAVTTHPTCFRCGRTASKIPHMVEQAIEETQHSSLNNGPFMLYTADDLAREDGTFNIHTNHFACDACYIAIGMPSTRHGWVAP